MSAPDFTRSPYSKLVRSLPFWLVTAFVGLLAVLILTDRHWLRLELSRSADEAVQRLGVYQTSLLTTIDRHLYLPRVLASDPRIVQALADPLTQTDDATSRLLAIINAQAGSDEIFLMDEQGLTHWSSNYTTATSFVGNNYSYRPYFKTAINGRPGFYFAVGATSGKPGLFLSAPVTGTNDEITGVIVVKIDLGPLEESWLGSGDAVWVTDNEGIVFLSSSPRWHYVATRPVSESHQRRLIETRQYGSNPVKPLTPYGEWQSERWSLFDLGDEGIQVLFGSPVGGYPWTMHLRQPLERVRQQVRLGQALVILLALTATGGILYGRERRRRATAQQAVTRLIEEREHHQRAIIQNTDVGLLNLDARFQPLFINEKARQLFALGEEETALDPKQLLSPWHTKNQGAYRAEGCRRDGSRFPALVTLNPIQVGDQDEYILTVQDITELTQAQLALEEANEVLEHRVEERTRDLQAAQAALAQNQKLAALGRMSSAIAHEINQPITALSNYIASSRLLLQRGKTETVDQNMGRIEAMVDRLSKLSRQLRIFAGKRNTGSAPVSLSQPIHYALELLSPRLKETGIDYQLKLTRDVNVQANAMFLEQILVNLIGNAIDALQETPSPQIHIDLSASLYHPGGVQLSLTDNGPGMTEEQLAHIFEPFYTTKKVGDGMGLGLAISYNLAQDMGAELTVVSRPGEGTTFTLTFSEAQWMEVETE